MATTEQADRVASLEAKIDQLLAEADAKQREAIEIRTSVQNLEMEANQLRVKADKLKAELARAKLPFAKGDIVQDDQGVRYRVHDVVTDRRFLGWNKRNRRDEFAEAGSVWGIRLTKTGNEAYATPREIVSKTITKV